MALLHRRPRQRLRVGESGAPDVTTHLAHLGLDPDLATRGHRPYLGTVSLWGTDTPLCEEGELLGLDRVFHLDRERFDQDLRDAVQRAGVEVLDIGPLLALDTAKDRFQLSLREPLSGTDEGSFQLIAARFLVDATGRRAVVARRLGSERKYLDRQVALVLRRPLRQPSQINDYAAVEAEPDGWWYGGGTGPDATIAFMTDADIARTHGLLQSEKLAARLAETQLIGPELATVGGSARPSIHVASNEFSSVVAGPNWLAVGDAAIGLDPLTSSGISCALGDGLAAAEAIATARATGTADALHAYAERVAQAVDAFRAQWRATYRREGRWPEAQFWQRRHSAGKSS